MSRWKVECGFWWVAMQVDEQGREIPGTAKRFPTHAEALAYANHEARLTPTSITLKVTFDSRRLIYLKAGDDTFIIARHEWRPLERFLLAAARHTH
ncbi:hypothetical protein QPX34_07065 [Corynebacterium accolens]|uniref:Uncharacterized protein n=1 Tax=Corynebacterium accolens TaxID=38284 RepID=A0ABT7FQA9_9CORY|nr:hypothetical protein [Corynebacterium accolens]MDK4247785.1 hypothetical protein [Corynebacterium accolens]MDK4338312.1 hypothetical protein [Corynebacterium accolens]